MNKLALTLTAEQLWELGNDRLLRFIRSDSVLTRDDRQFIAGLIEGLYWQAHEHSRSEKPATAITTYRKQGRKRPLRLGEDNVTTGLFMTGIYTQCLDPSEPGTRQEVRRIAMQLTGLEWDALRKRVDRMAEPHRSRYREMLDVTPGQSVRR